MGLYKSAVERFAAAPGDANKMLDGAATAKDAAMVVVCNALLNLDEVITKN